MTCRLRYLEDRFQPDGGRAQHLLVFLPGAYTTPEDFVTHGLVEAVRQHKLPCDIVIPELLPAHVSDHSFIARLHGNVISPLMQSPYQTLWLTGISLGAFCALAYTAVHIESVSGIHLIAPYAGTQDVLRPIRAAGSLERWAQAPIGQHEDEEHLMWRWLAHWKQHTIQRPPLWMGIATEDRFLSNQQLLAAQLPPNQIHTTTGKHDWPAWRSLWQDFLALGPLSQLHHPSTECCP